MLLILMTGIFHPGSGDPTAPLAYLDPGTGSIILQALLGVLFGTLLGFKLFWLRLKSISAWLRGPRDDGDEHVE